RHWFISDSNGAKREVEGAGVVGEQPILEPSQMHYYTSWCPLETEIGMMKGTFLMEKEDGSTFKVVVPEFQMLVPHRMN
ncbi:MAG: Co(2+)/Mg(2+) efflux protein ApaG, partial [Saprospiraceae bacterium]